MNVEAVCRAIVKVREANQAQLNWAVEEAHCRHVAAYRAAVLCLLPRDDPLFPLLEALAAETTIVREPVDAKRYLIPPQLTELARAAIIAKYGCATTGEKAMFPPAPVDRLWQLVEARDAWFIVNVPALVKNEREAYVAAQESAQAYAARQITNADIDETEEEVNYGPQRELDVVETPPKPKRRGKKE